jgi:uncharacterized membrane protein
VNRRRPPDLSSLIELYPLTFIADLTCLTCLLLAGLVLFLGLVVGLLVTYVALKYSSFIALLILVAVIALILQAKLRRRRP